MTTWLRHVTYHLRCSVMCAPVIGEQEQTAVDEAGGPFRRAHWIHQLSCQVVLPGTVSEEKHWPFLTKGNVNPWPQSL